MAELRAEALRTVVLQALRDLITTETAVAREDVLEAMIPVWKDLGVKSIDVRLPDGMVVASISLVEESDQVVVTDRPAFTEWVRKRAPEMVTEDESPLVRITRVIRGHYDGPTDTRAGESHARNWSQDVAIHVLAELGINPDPPEPRVSRSYETALLAGLHPVEQGEEDDEPMRAVEPESGEIVPGVVYVPASDPEKIQVRYKPSSEKGREAIAEAWRTGRLPSIEGLPEIEA